MKRKTSENIYSLPCRGGCEETVYVIEEKKSNEERIRDEYCPSCLPDQIVVKMREFLACKKEETLEGVR